MMFSNRTYRISNQQYHALKTFEEWGSLERVLKSKDESGGRKFGAWLRLGAAKRKARRAAMGLHMGGVQRGGKGGIPAFGVDPGVDAKALDDAFGAGSQK